MQQVRAVREVQVELVTIPQHRLRAGLMIVRGDPNAAAHYSFTAVVHVDNLLDGEASATTTPAAFLSGDWKRSRPRVRFYTHQVHNLGTELARLRCSVTRKSV